MLIMCYLKVNALLISMDVTPVQPKPLRNLKKNPLLHYLRTQVGLAPTSALRSKVSVRSEQSAVKQKVYTRLHKVTQESPKAQPIVPLQQQVDVILESDHSKQRPLQDQSLQSQLIQQQLEKLQQQVKQLQNQQKQQKEQEFFIRHQQLQKQYDELPQIQTFESQPFTPVELLQQPFQLHQLQQFQQPQFSQLTSPPQRMAALVGRSARSSTILKQVHISPNEKSFANYSVPHDHDQDQFVDFTIPKNCSK